MLDRVPYAFRTTVAAWVLVPAVVIEFLNFVQRGMPWRGEGIWTVEWMAIGLFLLGPVVSGFAAVETARLFRPGSVHRHRALWNVVAWCGLAVCAVHLGFTATGLIIGLVPVSVDWASMAAGSLLQCLAILWYTAIGMMAGRVMLPLAAGVVAAVLGLGSSYALGSAYGGDEFALLDFGASTVSRIGLDYNPRYLGFQAAVLVVSAVIMVAVSLYPRGGGVHARWTAVGVSATLAVLLGAADASGPDQRWVASPEPPDTCVGVGDDDWAEYCVYAEHRGYIDELDGVYRSLRLAAVENGYDAFVFEKAWEMSRTFTPADGSVAGFTFVSSIHEEGELDPYRLAYDLVYPDQCEELSSGAPPGDGFWVSMDRLSFTWISLMDIDPDRYAPESFSHGRAEPMTPEEARTVMDGLQNCDWTVSE